jgi:hypothetical protein
MVKSRPYTRWDKELPLSETNVVEGEGKDMCS